MAPRSTPAQLKLLIDLIEMCDEVRYGKGAPDKKKEAWVEIAKKLNALGGATKNGDGWKKAFTEWRSHIKNKMRNGAPLNDREKKCRNVMCLDIAVTGVPQTVELGLPDRGVSEQAEETETIIIEGIDGAELNAEEWEFTNPEEEEVHQPEPIAAAGSTSKNKK